MHLVFVEKHGLEETEVATDLDQSPAELVVLSFSDSDLNAFAAGWRRARESQPDFPSLRLANLAQLKHPLSVDVYCEKTLCHARGILIRLIGGTPYWSYGLQQVLALARRQNIAVAVLPADGRADEQLDSFSTLPESTLRRLRHLCDAGGEVAAHAALAQLALSAGLYASPVRGTKKLGSVGCWHPEHGVSCPQILPSPAEGSSRKTLCIVFYRSFVSAVDLKPIETLYRRCEMRGFHVVALFLPSLKAPDAAAWLSRQLAHYRPAAIINATSFSGRRGDNPSVLDEADVPVFQIALSTSDKSAWAASSRGLSPADMAMHVVLPEVDGRIFGGIASFKQAGKKDDELEFSAVSHHPDEQRIDAILSRISRWTALQDIPAPELKTAFILSSYPGKPWQIAHAVGLDGLASLEAILKDTGYEADLTTGLDTQLEQAVIRWPRDDYLAALASLPASLQNELSDIWGDVETDPHFRDGCLEFQAMWCGHALVAVQPERGSPETKTEDYHDLTRTPPHHYVGFYLWLRLTANMDAVVHIGAHGTLEWLPGKAVALSEACWPEALIADLPVLYPFIVNDPGEAAQAKRRIGAVTIGHIPPPLSSAEIPEKFHHLEALLDEFSNADGLDPKRRDRLVTDITSEAETLGLDDDLGLCSTDCDAERLTRIDRFVCDIKDSQFTRGLHVFGRADKNENPAVDTQACAQAEREGLKAGLSGRRVNAGPAGSPYRGRMDVLPTGRNLYAVDPLCVPSKSAYHQGVGLADELIRRHLQEEGDWPRRLVLDLWGSQSMRTAGEEFAMALHLLGVRPLWVEASERVDGFEILPLAMLDRPRIDVTLRCSGLFRDMFPTLMTMYDQVIEALTDRDEPSDQNPFSTSADSRRIFTPAPESYGSGVAAYAEDFTDDARDHAAKAWLSASSWAFHKGEHKQDIDAISRRVQMADGFVHLQDLSETDLLVSMDYAAHEAGFAAANSYLGGAATSYHLDSTNPEAPKARTLNEEIARVVYGRATSSGWIGSMQDHGFRGAAEIAVTLDHMAAFAHLADVVGPHLFDLYYEQTLGDEDVSAFLKSANPAAYQAMQDKFKALHQSGLWKTRRNSIAMAVEERL